MQTLEPPFFVVSDTHWYHANIVEYCDRHTQIEALIGPRPKVKAIDHNEYMVEKWNSVVGPDDKVLHLGDLFMSKHSADKFKAVILPRLNGEKYLIMGNHDRLKPREYQAMGFEVLKPFTTWVNGRRVSFSHYPWSHSQFLENELHVHGHIHGNGYPRTKDWADGTEPTMPNQINVSVEAINYTPVAITDLIC